jgi:hypothetical protein
MGFLFGHLYDSQRKFTHDQAMFRRMASATETEPKPRPVSPGQESMPDVTVERNATSDRPPVREEATLPRDDTGISNTGVTPRLAPETAIRRELDSATIADSADNLSGQSTRKRRRSNDGPNKATIIPANQSGNDGERVPTHPLLDSNGQRTATIFRPISPEDYAEAWKREAFEAALGTNPGDWNDITLVSVSGHQQREEEL